MVTYQYFKMPRFQFKQ